MEGTNTGEVAFNCLGLDLDCLVPEAGDPLKDAMGSGRKELSWAEEETGADPDKVNVRSLPCRVCLASAGYKSMPQVEADLSREVRMHFIPIRWDFGVEGFGER